MQLVFTILNSLGLVGLGIFLHFWISGLHKRIENLQTLAEEQKKTLDAVRERAEEFDKLSKAYKQALTDFQEMGEKLDARRAQVVKELEEANAKKEAEIVALKQIELAEIEIKQKSFDRLPEIHDKLEALTMDLERQLKILSPLGEAMLTGNLIGRGSSERMLVPVSDLYRRPWIFDRISTRRILDHALRSPSASRPIKIGDSGETSGDDGTTTPKE